MFSPRHTHPFTPEEALLLDPPTITAEVARLRHSVAHLGQSNQALRDYLAEEGFDQELASSIDENERTIASQHERIALLQWALARHVGAPSAGHYVSNLGAADPSDVPAAGDGRPSSGAAAGPPGLAAIGFGGVDEVGRSATTIGGDDGNDVDRRPVGATTAAGRSGRPSDPASAAALDIDGEDGVHL